MKFVRTVVVFDRGGLLDSQQWADMHESYIKALSGVVHPPGNDTFVIRKKIKKRTASGAPSGQWTRNGVVPIKNQFLSNLKDAGWHAEEPAGLEKGSAALQQAHQRADVLLKEYPGKRDFRIEDQDWGEVFHEKVGDFDFFTELDGGVRCVIEWETGNISSSHRSMNKLCLVMLAGLIDIGVVILPSRLLYAHLTDRIGNWMELSPYLPLWHRIGQGMERGLLAVTVVEHDELTDNPAIPFIAQGSDGRSAEGAAKLL
jgi:hypothetical protein